LNDVIVYNNGEIELKVSVEDENIWLTQKQLGELFSVEVNTINYHIKNIFKEKELDKNPTIRKIRIVQQEGNREIQRDVEHYNLDMIISIGYRVNSKKATKFRQWATSVLKNYIQNGYAINTHKITEQRLLSLENDMSTIKSHIKNNTLEVKQGIFFDGQIYDAYTFVGELIKSALEKIIIIDNYCDDTVLTLLSKNTKVKTSIYTKTISKQLSLDAKKYNEQYKNLSLIKFDLSHDRFLIIDNTVYHIGASLKDLGKKWFAFSKIESDSLSIFKKLEDKKS
jgi:prophage antirepressor-like protein